jgi:hypothetical protein
LAIDLQAEMFTTDSDLASVNDGIEITNVRVPTARRRARWWIASIDGIERAVDQPS